MEQKEYLEVLDRCLKQIESMSPEDIVAREKEKGIDWLEAEPESNKIKRALSLIRDEVGITVQVGSYLISFDLFLYPLCLDFYFVLFICNKRLFGLSFYKSQKCETGIPLTIGLLNKSIEFSRGKSNA